MALLMATQANAGWVIGYNGGYYPYLTRNMKAHAQSFNLRAQDVSDPMKVNSFFRGITTGGRINVVDDFGFFAFTFTTRKVETNWAKSADVEQKWRIRTNYLTAEFGFGGERLKGGAGVDFGGTKFFVKKKDKTGETSSWEKFYDGGGLFDGGFLSTGFSFFGELRVQENLYMRLFAMLPMGSSEIADTKTDTRYGFYELHYGLSLYFDLFRQD